MRIFKYICVFVLVVYVDFRAKMYDTQRKIDDWNRSTLELFRISEANEVSLPACLSALSIFTNLKCSFFLHFVQLWLATGTQEQYSALFFKRPLQVFQSTEFINLFDMRIFFISMVFIDSCSSLT